VREFASPRDAGNRDVLEALRRVLKAVDDLIASSEGVAGLHLNGDLAPWDELVAGGRYELWLADLETAREVLATHTREPDTRGEAPPITDRR
jgi:hypothetical protein